MNNEILPKLQSELTPPTSGVIDYEGEHSRHAIRNAQGTRTLIHNAPFIFTCDEDDKMRVLKNHSIIVSGDTITDVALAKGISHENFDIVYDAGKRGGTVITPGFINTHTHPPMYLMRSAMMLDEGEGIDDTIAAMPRWERAMSDTDYMVATIGDITEQIQKFCKR